MPKYYDFKVCGYYLYFTSHCTVEAMHVHASDKRLNEVLQNLLLKAMVKRLYKIKAVLMTESF